MDDNLDLALPISEALNVVSGEIKGNGKSATRNSILGEQVSKSELFPSDVTVTSELHKSGSGDHDQIVKMIDTPADEVRNVVLVGRTGNGKSATGNSMLGEKLFKSKLSAVGVTTTCELQTTVLKDGLILNVIDTPGLFDFSGDPDFIQKEIVNCIGLAKDGIHAVLVVLSLTNRFSREEKDAVTYLLNFFGERMKDYMIVVITGGDELEANEETMEDVMGHDCPEPLKDILVICGNRYVVIDNRTRDEEKMGEQLNQLYCLVEDVYEKNGRMPYIDDIFLDIKEELNPSGLDAQFSHEVSQMDSISTNNAKVSGLDAQFSHEVSRMDSISTNNAKVSGLEAKASGSYQNPRKREVATMVKSKLEQTAHMLKHQLLEEKLARHDAEEKAQADRSKSEEEIQKLRMKLSHTTRDSKSHLAFVNTCGFL